MHLVKLGLLGSSGECVYPRTTMWAARRKRRPGFRRKRPSPHTVSALRASIFPRHARPAATSLSCALRAREKTTCACSGKSGGKKPPPNFSAPGSGGASSRHPRVLAARLKQAVAPACRGRFAPASRAPSPDPFGLRPRLRPLSVTPSCNAAKPRQNPGDSSFPRKPRRPPGGRLW